METAPSVDHSTPCEEISLELREVMAHFRRFSFNRAGVSAEGTFAMARSFAIAWNTGGEEAVQANLLEVAFQQSVFSALPPQVWN